MDHRDLDRHRDPVLPFPPPAAGGFAARDPVIVSIAEVAGRRVSRVRRGDGSTFTVTVPPGGIDDQPGPDDRFRPWIREDGGRRRTPTVSLDDLAARVGMHLVPDAPADGPEP